MPAAPTYDRVHRALHWISVALMLAVFPVGVIISDFEDRAIKNPLYDFHKWFGLVILTVTVLRLSYKLTHPVHEATDIARHERLISMAVHWAIYALLVAVPLLGWISSSALGFPVKWFNLVLLPDLVGKNAPLGLFLLDVHMWVAWGLGALIAMHIGAAVVHHVVKKDSVLTRMIPSLGRTRMADRAATR